MAFTNIEIISLLEKFGFSTNAAKAYISLLINNPATGYEISKDAGIPRSAIYATLNRMEKMGIVNYEGDSPKKFIPLSPSSLVEHLQSMHTDQLSDLNNALDNLDLDEEAFDFWHIHGYENLVFKMREAINNANSSVIINVWNRELEKVEKEDQDVVCNVQKGMKSQFYNRGRYSVEHEIGVHHFHRLICKHIN